MVSLSFRRCRPICDLEVADATYGDQCPHDDAYLIDELSHKEGRRQHPWQNHWG